MREPEYLSPSAIMCYDDSPDEYYLRYLTADRPPRMEQTKPMSVGSSFDAFIKADLAQQLGIDDPELQLDYLLKTQIEHHITFALEAGKHCFEQYKESPAYETLVKELQQAEEINFEGDLYGEVDGVPFRVKPDICFRLNGKMFTGDWKVNNYCGKSKKSPAKGYVDCDGKPHRHAVIATQYGIPINTAVTMEDVDAKWALQLAIGARVLGCPAGFDEVVGIDQLIGVPAEDKPRIRVARHRCLIDKDFQDSIFEKAINLWSYIKQGNIFHWMEAKEAEKHMKHLDKVASLLNSKDELDEWALQL